MEYIKKTKSNSASPADIARRLGWILTLLIIPFCLTACGDDDEPKGDTDHDPALIGTWIYTMDGDYSYVNVKIEVIYTFRSNGRCTQEWYEYVDDELDYSDKIEGTWSTSDNILTVRTTDPDDGHETESEQIEYIVDGDRLSLDGVLLRRK